MPMRARNQLVVDHLHIVGAATAYVASRLTHVSRDDLASAGAFALVRAAEKFDATLGVPFGAFARGRVNWALKDELRAMDWAPREVRVRAKATAKVRQTLTSALGRTPSVAEIAAAMGVDTATVREGLADAERMVTSLDAPDAPEIVWTGYLPEELAIASERDEFLRRAVDALPDRKRDVVRAIYFEDRTVTEIADELGVSHAAVSQQRAEGVRMLRDALDRHYADSPAVDAPPTSRSSASVLDAYFERLAEGGQRFTRAILSHAVGV
ncbi:RNA polymerase sigma factor for flagellar operon FliA [Microbacterium phyllosphaerae]|uniref:RNA polymerase sigma factor for flagellar operon FliA n=1 Tax=Microbacterium phyllosphaerae TaxID=124798 RepID=A0ABS4WRY5_9MICO|nr:sigma-70 family RNA polymerase sigma factor [Microbacterium phyllosphaerae]MBP2378967.1 RNA polymerase sigma factor for flagellar operon FliA [Microbacterium phyllosphaerae]